MALAAMEEDEEDERDRAPDSTKAKSLGSFFPAAEDQQGDGRMQQLGQPLSRRDRIIMKLKPMAVRGTKKMGTDSLGGGRGAMPATPGGKGAGTRQQQDIDSGLRQPKIAHNA
ncbi:unnamed protein product, partial [Scytosiphon promiscuus]